MLLLLSLFLACAAGAQDADLPKLGADPAIKSGRLPNGISWFFADNKSHKGLMDIAIVQKMDPSLGMDDLYGTARHRFVRSGFGSEPVEIFLARNGVLPGERGYIRCSKGSIRYHLDNVSSARGDAAQDSILFSLFNLLKVSAEENQPSSSQAIVFSGDFDHGRMLSKLNLFSILCNSVPGSVPEYGYVWDPGAGTTNFRVEEKALAKVIVDWRMARTPDKYMATVLPVISDTLSGEMGWVLRSRLYPAARKAG